MDRHQGPIGSRRRLAALALILLLGAGGCSHRHAQVSVNSPATPHGGAGLTVSGSAHSSTLNTLIVLGVLLGIYHAGETEAPPAATPDPSRRVAEQDCTRPVEDSGANLKCR